MDKKKHKLERLPSSMRKHIRKEKARLRREVVDVAERQQKIQEIYAKFNL